MDKLKVTLSRKIGPFSVGVWLIVIIAGIGLGLLVSRRFRRTEGDFSGTALPSNEPGLDALPGTQGAPTIVQSPDFETVRNIRTEQDRFRDEVDQRFTGIIDTVQEGDDSIRDELDKVFTPIIDRLDDIVNAPGEPGPAITPKPKPKPPAPKPAPKPKAKEPTGTTYTVVRGDTLTKIGQRFGVPWPTIYDANRSVIGPNPDLIIPGQKLFIPQAA